MSTSRRASSVISSTFASLRAHLWLLLLIQIPEASSDFIDKLFPGHADDVSWLRLLLLFPYFCFSSSLTTAFTFSAIASEHRGEPVTLRRVWRDVAPKLSILAPVSVLLGVILVMGFIAMVAPGIYFMAIFLFVPQWIVAEPDRLPWTVYLAKSKRLAKTAFAPTVVAVTIFFVLNLCLYFVDGFLDARLLGLLGKSAAQLGLSLCLGLTLSVSIGAVVNVWISHYFLKLREKSS